MISNQNKHLQLKMGGWEWSNLCLVCWLLIETGNWNKVALGYLQLWYFLVTNGCVYICFPVSASPLLHHLWVFLITFTNPPQVCARVCESSHTFTIRPPQLPSLISDAWLTYSSQVYTSVCKHVHTLTLTRKQAHATRRQAGRQGQALSVYRLIPRLNGSGGGLMEWIEFPDVSLESCKHVQRLGDMFEASITQEGWIYPSYNEMRQL